ncbi:hypothetical protein COO60DRAFT_721923 [Scenedesmus sp. NREL 46B-D3]|nr:hypothetical protein COO60DRAFT_721923 [Scenedesmus sp. NREL 46B-D3]
MVHGLQHTAGSSSQRQQVALLVAAACTRMLARVMVTRCQIWTTKMTMPVTRLQLKTLPAVMAATMTAMMTIVTPAVATCGTMWPSGRRMLLLLLLARIGCWALRSKPLCAPSRGLITRVLWSMCWQRGCRMSRWCQASPGEPRIRADSETTADAMHKQSCTCIN